MLGGFIPIFTLIFFVKVIENSLDYSLMNTTRQALFLPVDRDSKYDGKTAIDTFFWRFGDLIQAGAIYAGTHWLQWQAPQFALLNLCLAFAWIALAVALGRGYAPEGPGERHQRRSGGGRPDPRPACTRRAERSCTRSRTRRFATPTRATCCTCAPAARTASRCRAGCSSIRADARSSAPGPRLVEELRIAVIASDVDGMEARSVFLVRRVTPG